MTSKIILSLFTLLIFLAGLGSGMYFGIAAGTAPAVGQLWAGAKEMQAAIILIDKNMPQKAKTLLCSSIKTRIVIMDLSKPLQGEIIVRQTQELEQFVYQNVAKGKSELSDICHYQKAQLTTPAHSK